MSHHSNTSSSSSQTTARSFIPIGIAVLTISDTRQLDDDRSGDLLVERINEAGHELKARLIVRDEVDAIQDQLLRWVQDSDINVIITKGGTGFTGSDVTPEAVEPLLDKKIDGFSILFHHMSLQKIGTSTIQSRAMAGMIRNRFIFCLPGSPNACKDAWDEILRYQLDYRHKPCNFIEIMQRADEHLS